MTRHISTILSALLYGGAILCAVRAPAVSGEVLDGARYAAVTYYLNARTGSDDNAGTSPDAPLRTVARANRLQLQPGDRLLLAGGQTFQGALSFDRATRGEEGRPILVSSYGSGRATIDGSAGDALKLNGCERVMLVNLNLTGSGRKGGNSGAGVTLLGTSHVNVDDVAVSGFRLAGISTSGDVSSRITHVYAHDNGAAGITTNGGVDGQPRTKDLYIGYCVAENNPGDPKNLTNHSGNGIVVGGVDGATIEYCEAMNNGWDMPRQGNGPVGIWGWNCDRLTIQFCVSHNNKSPGNDGGGFDFDGGVTNSVMQYNLAYNNAGTGYLLCQYPGAPTWKDNIVRYNISLNDGWKNFHCGIGIWKGGDGISDAQIYNNTIVNAAHAVVADGDVPGMVYTNNLFVAGTEVLAGTFARSHFAHDLYWSTTGVDVYVDGATRYRSVADWAEATKQESHMGKVTGIHADPMLVLPDVGTPLPTAPRALAAMRLCRVREGSPCSGAGAIVPDNGGRDFFGSLVPADKAPTIGACQQPVKRPVR